jgi:type I restriction enzyme, S subunit
VSLPNGWAETTLGQCSEAIQYGLTCTSSQNGEGYRYVRITDIQNGQIKWAGVPYANERADKAKPYAIEVGDILFARTGATVGKSHLMERVESPSVFASYLIRLRCSEGVLLPPFAAWYFQSKDYWEQIAEGAEGTGQPNFNGTKLAALTLPLPPLPEQRRIVAKLDALTARLTRARMELERVAVLAKMLRERGLENAFSEGFTKDGKVNQGWRTVRFEEVAEIASNLVSPETVLDLPHIAPNHIESGRPRLLPYKTVRQDGVISGKHRFYPGQLLYSKIRPYLRKVVQVDFDGACSADMYPIRPKCHPRYLMYRMLSPQFTWLTTQQEGRTVLPKINQSALNAIPTPVPSEKMQESVALRLDAIFSRAERLEAETTRARALLDHLESAILAKAFRGELVPQDPNDEPASALLERIRAQRTAPTRGKRLGADRRATA